MLLFLFIFFTNSVQSQQYVNGVLSTGATSISGVAAPAGTTWSECQNPTGNTTIANTNAGFGAQLTANNSVADDFTVAGTWNITKITVYAYSTGYAGTTSPFTDLRIRIHNSSPLAGPTTIVFGDLTTNRLTSSSFTNVYRIFNSVVTPASAPGTTRMIWKLEAAVSFSLTSGTYWLEYQTGTALTSNFTPPSSPVGVRSLPGYNAIQRQVATWSAAIDDGQGPASPASVPVDFPFIIDYTSPVCTGTPNPGNTLSTAASVCPTIPFTLSMQNPTGGSGITYQWQSAPASSGPWTNISGATNSTYITTLTATTFYRCNVTCSGNTAASNPVQVSLAPSSGCYCSAGATSTQFEKISNVQFNTINNASTSTAGYENFTAISTSVVHGQVIPITVTISGGFSTDQVLAWIDYNQNGSFSDPGELVYTSPLGVGPHTGNLTISTSALTGSTRMRIRMHDANPPPPDVPNSSPCGNSTYGQVEDYTINIQPCLVGNITTQPVNKTVQCSGSTSFNVVTSGSVITYQWEVNDNSPLGWQNLTNGGVYSGVTSNTLNLTNVPSTMNGYRYRVVYQGPCTGIRFSDSVTLTVSQLVATVSPASATICTGTVRSLALTNAASPTTVNFSSGAINIAIPDNSPAGINHTIAVSGIPAGSVISNMAVTFSIPAHTWAGDLCVVLKAPNGQILNLDYFISATGAGPSAAGMVNTTISSTGTALLSSANSPYTGIFRADGVTTPAAGNPPSGPTGYTPTTGVVNMSALQTTMNGNWTLAIYDGFAGDAGSLTNWSISITYGLQAAGIWTANPATPNTMFTDAGATVPYTGTAVNTIYVNPSVNTVYTVAFSTPTPCTSGPTSVPVNVVTPISGIVNPANKSVCVGGNTSFTVSASGGPISYQWQVSTNGGLSYSNISGATSASLDLTNVTQAMHNNRYRVTLSAPPCTGSTTTPDAVLTVNPLPAVNITAAPYTALRPQLTTTLTAASTPAGASYSWRFNGSPVTGATGSTLVTNVDGIGTYTATVTDVNGCINTSSPFVITGLSDSRMFIYPNPAVNGQFQVRLYSAINFDYRNISIYSTSGQRVYQKSLATTEPWQRMDINLSGQPAGVYVVVVSDGYHTKRAIGKVVIGR